MPVETLCETCGKRLRAPDQLAGKRMNCPACKSPVEFPAEQAVSLSDAIDLLSSGPLAVGNSPTDDRFSPPAPFAAARRERSGMNRSVVVGLSILGGCVLLVVLVAVILSSPKNSDSDLAANRASRNAGGTAAGNTSQPGLGTASLAPKETPPNWNRQGDIELAKVRLAGTPGQPGQGMQLFLYRTVTNAAPHSLPCVFIAPAGASIVTGMGLADGDRQEHYPWVRAGFAVVSYEIDGPVDLERAKLADLQAGF